MGKWLVLIMALLLAFAGAAGAQGALLTPGTPSVSDPGTGSTLIISWEVPADPLRVGFNLYRGSSIDGSYQRINQPLLTQNTYNDLGLVHGTAYWYRVTAVDAGGLESEPSASASGVPIDSTPPGVPTVNSAAPTGTSGEITVTWLPNSEADLAGYNIYYGRDPIQPLTRTNNRLITGTSWLQTGLVNGQTYYFRVTAMDARGNESGQSSVLSAVPTDLSPPRVVNLIPNHRQTGVGTGEPIRVVFDDQMDPISLTPATVRLLDSVYQPVVGAAVDYDEGTRTATINHPQLSVLSVYWVNVTTGAKNLWGAPLNPEYTATFTTGMSVYNRPHGDYLSNADYCELCHSPHRAVGAGLLVRSTETAVCYFCHNGSQAETNIKAAFSVPSSVYHPVSDTGVSPLGALRCSSCHNPHGDQRPDGTVFPKLLRASGGTATYYSGNQFCLVCHGDKANALAVHYNTGFPGLLPPSGTQVTCSSCHEPHAGALPSLTRATEETLCFRCHSSGANSRSGRNIQQEFNQAGGSRHDITSSTGAKVECSSCHNPHTVARDDFDLGTQATELSDPNNTRRWFAKGPGPNTTTGDLTAFCLVCHDGTPPTFIKNSTTMVPFTIVFPAWMFTNAAGGWDKSAYISSGHYAGGRMQCDWCHGSHGTPYPRLTTNPEDTPTTNGICLRCHAGAYPSGVTASRPASAVDVRIDLVKASRHPALDLSGRHINTETLNNAGTANRHSECVDCHDPHSATATAGVVPNAAGSLRNVTGVGFNDYTVSTRPAWTSLAYNSAVYKFRAAIDYQYELCYKCHSSYSFGMSPPSGATDSAKEFNPNNPSHHAVEAAGNNPFTQPDGTSYASSLIGGYTPASLLYCTDCHGPDASSTVKGPHGSSNSRILRAPYNTNTGKRSAGDTSSHLCFRCHDYNVYRGSGSPASTGFNEYEDGRFKKNLHAISDHNDEGCMACHPQTPHGMPRTRMIVLRSDGPPYASTVARINSFTPKSSTNNTYSKSSCTLSHTSH